MNNATPFQHVAAPSGGEPDEHPDGNRHGQSGDHGGFGRRTVLHGGALLAAVAGSGAFAGCATGGGGGDDDDGNGQLDNTTPIDGGTEVTDDNPFGVDGGEPIDVVIFNGGYGHEYAQRHQEIYVEDFPDAEVDHTETQEITQVLQPRFVNGNPPDLIDNSGAQFINNTTLVNNRQVRELTQLLDAPSYDLSGMTVRDTLIEGALATTTYDVQGEEGVFGIDYVLNIPGIWYDAKLFRDEGWEYPQTWDALLEFGAETAAAGYPVWIYQGQFPGYMLTVFNSMLQKYAGKDVLIDIDNLKEGAWEHEAVRDTLEALHQLKERNLIRPGTAGLSHIEAQADWLEHGAVLIPCGSWLESEMRSQIPEDFEMSVAPTPSLTENDAMPFEAVPFHAGETFIVPTEANNPAGGLELLRIMLSEQGAQSFAEITSALTIVDGVHDDQDLGSVVASSAEVLAAARSVEPMDTDRWGAWYASLQEEGEEAMGAMLVRDLDPAGFIERMQQRSDQIREDDQIEKHSR